MSIVQVFYVSRASVPYDATAVKNILQSSRRNNERDDVTGCLLFSGCHFGQVLEGQRPAVMSRIKRIRDDPRHTNVRLLLDRELSVRDYDRWSMGYLHDLDLEDELAALLLDPVGNAAIEKVLARMQPDTVMGAL